MKHNLDKRANSTMITYIQQAKVKTWKTKSQVWFPVISNVRVFEHKDSIPIVLKACAPFEENLMEIGLVF